MKICDQLKKTIQVAMNKTFKKGDVAVVDRSARKLVDRKVTVISSEKTYIKNQKTKEEGTYVDVKDSAGKMHKMDVEVLRHATAKTATKKKAATAKPATVVSSKASGAKKPATKKAATKSAPKQAQKAAKKSAPKATSKAKSKAGTVCVKLFNKKDTKDGIKAAQNMRARNKKLTYREALSKTMSKEYPSSRK